MTIRTSLHDNIADSAYLNESTEAAAADANNAPVQRPPNNHLDFGTILPCLSHLQGNLRSM